MRTNVHYRSILILSAILGCSSLVTDAMAQGLMMPGAGPVHRSMAGASTATAVDAAGAGLWNPAVIRALPENEVMFGAELVYGDTYLSSSGPGGSGSNFSNSGLPAIPTVAAVYHMESMPVSLGIGLYGLMGASVNFPQSADNPLLNATGPVFANASALAIKPSVACQLTDRLTVGVAPIISTMSLGMSPAFFAPNAGGGFPDATPGRFFWGGGFETGLMYELDCCWSFGASYRSPTWFETFEYNAQDANGNQRDLELNHTLPQIVSLGAAYHGFERTTLAVDVRYLDYANTRLWGDAIPTPGLRWDSIFSVALGAQYQLTDRVAVRMGYLANENPIPDLATLFNMQLPTINRHQLSIGGGCKLTPSITSDVAIVYGFKNSISSTIPLPGGGGPVGVGLSQEFISASFGLRFKY